ncbi:mammalian cell entry protein [Nocardia nova]|uniref:Mammalian cell entry protein n=1 Tax=Nocardia nova TaxID=37330 RepID=A0A2S6AKH8_9NOCA|nr:MCE family protein [Nocardia nova]PPJ24962.1 mammalian cell entry protein [Nocardia nova]PPJ35724.1 mammalian cell entry protein [Nocardia nova]
MNRIRRASALTAALLVCGLAAGCRMDGPNSIPLPNNAIHHGSYTVHVQLRDAQNLVGNSVVKADNVTVGVLRKIEVRNYIAVATVDIDTTVALPKNTTAQLAQTSVLGAQYLELTTPKNAPPAGRLRDGDTIALSASSEYPATEEVLSALSLLLNGSGLQQVRTIMSELNQAVGGREDVVNSAIGRIQTFVDGLDTQRANIVRAIDSLGTLSQSLADQNAALGKGIEQIQPAVKILDDQRQQLTTMLDSVGRFGAQAAQVLRSSKDSLAADLASLQPVLHQLAASGKDLPESLLIALSVPFPVTAVDGIRGDYLNLFLTLDLSADAIKNKVIGSIPFPDMLPSGPDQAVDPLTAPTQPARGGR